jgi:hypothetical protein
LVLVVFDVEADEGGDGSDFWLGLRVCEGARKGEDRGYGETLHSMAPGEGLNDEV